MKFELKKDDGLPKRVEIMPHDDGDGCIVFKAYVCGTYIQTLMALDGGVLHLYPVHDKLKEAGVVKDYAIGTYIQVVRS